MKSLKSCGTLTGGGGRQSPQASLGNGVWTIGTIRTLGTIGSVGREWRREWRREYKTEGKAGEQEVDERREREKKTTSDAPATAATEKPSPYGVRCFRRCFLTQWWFLLSKVFFDAVYDDSFFPEKLALQMYWYLSVFLCSLGSCLPHRSDVDPARAVGMVRVPFVHRVTTTL